jgi:CheY-like chemotaxis protein
MSAAGRRRLLLVEDDVSLRDLVGEHLRRGGFDVVETGASEEVLQLFQQGKLDYDVALVDAHLPGMSGVDLTRLLLAVSPLRPVLMMTGDDDAGLARRALGYGAAGYLLKPFQMFELDAALAQGVAMLDLVETTAVLARSQAEQLEDWGEAGGLLPRAWLWLGDEHSGAGSGHGSRVVTVAGLLARAVDAEISSRDLEILRTAARTHEMGRLLGPGGGAGVARRTAELLNDLGFDREVGDLVRQAAEPWSPGLSLGARILAVADRLDHEAVQRSECAVEPCVAIAAAIDAVIATAGVATDPGIVELLGAHRESLESVWVMQQRQRVPA